ncbi:MAG: trypsin-like peptidase domain-containing protein [Candidatus Babeliales bacterium]|nr:trypsin-like peptidase domain-containing protein [Candidatus Babeliales bacterium]
MNTQTKGFFALGLLVCLALGKTGYDIVDRQKKLEQKIADLCDHSSSLAANIDVVAHEPAVVERMVSTSQVWRPIQDQVKDTVVQVFAQIAELDLLQPYKSPHQATATGSGFFINDKGDFITNAHVVDQARSVWIQIPSLGKRIIDVDVLSVSPERDLALLRVKPEGVQMIKELLGQISYLPLGDSDIIHRSDEILALGYPLSQQSLKSTTGVISGREQHLIQMSAALNPGNSGGPSLNCKGEVIGINAANIPSAQNIGYLIPINDLKIVLDDMYKVTLLRKPFLGVLFNNATDHLTEFLGNPAPGGCYVVEVVSGSTLDRAGVKSGDMIYEINGNHLDIFGEMSVAWSEDKISIVDYVTRLSIGDDLNMVAYRNGKRKEMTVKFSQSTLPAIRRIYPGYENVDYEVFGGMVVMPLTLNHIHALGGGATGLAKFAELKNQSTPKLIITHIFPNSQVYRARSVSVGATINDVNGVEVHTLEDFRKAIKSHAADKFLTMRVSDHVARASDNVLVTLPFDKVLQEERKLSLDYKYPLSVVAQDLLKAFDANNAIVLARSGRIETVKDTAAAA